MTDQLTQDEKISIHRDADCLNPERSQRWHEGQRPVPDTRYLRRDGLQLEVEIRRHGSVRSEAHENDALTWWRDEQGTAGQDNPVLRWETCPLEQIEGGTRRQAAPLNLVEVVGIEPRRARLCLGWRCLQMACRTRG